MQMSYPNEPASACYGRYLAASTQASWDVDGVIAGRRFQSNDKFLPDGLSKVDRCDSLTAPEKTWLNRIQARTYVNFLALAERYIDAKILDHSYAYRLRDPTAFEALVRFSNEAIKHGKLFRRIARLIAEQMPHGYRFLPRADEVTKVVLGKSTWAVLALTLHVELFTQIHYEQSVQADERLAPLFKDVLLLHWKEGSRHAALDELEWLRCDRAISAEARDTAVDDFIELVVDLDGMLHVQAAQDAHYFAATCGRSIGREERRRLQAQLLTAYRWQYIVAGAEHPHFIKVLGSLVTDAQDDRIRSALATVVLN